MLNNQDTVENKRLFNKTKIKNDNKTAKPPLLGISFL